ncbi:hypothetical protein CLOM621_09036 [Clostridium sp. M62/1]|nr:hypothetical protein CLOM621_09036 [Clostridium sp. M62/1]
MRVQVEWVCINFRHTGLDKDSGEPGRVNGRNRAEKKKQIQIKEQ